VLLVNVALIGVFATKKPINATKTLFNDAESTENPKKGAQKKRKENKIKEIKRKGKEKEKEKNSPHFDKIYRNFDSKKTENNYQSVGEIFEEEKEKNTAKKEKENFNRSKRYFDEKFGSYFWNISDNLQLLLVSQYENQRKPT
jgi:hypothetical protein